MCKEIIKKLALWQTSRHLGFLLDYCSIRVWYLTISRKNKHFSQASTSGEQTQARNRTQYLKSSMLRPGSKAFTGENNLLVIFLKV